ncbi:hypothetical protein CAEBREN_19679 [Caenorhabditis brenneri]|uniref:Secreted protein n=1 Tax=Caenorhabditis brenneri TaxID=135651 RepID=G0NKD4_CAEBE|nr:hypothetical protein CAEBREN_19679 [Caenorhabditis brenneri]
MRHKAIQWLTIACTTTVVEAWMETHCRMGQRAVTIIGIQLLEKCISSTIVTRRT